MDKKKVLVVDDEPNVLNLTVAILKRAGYEAVIAANGKDALVLCEELKAELALIISDVSMPEMNGKELADCVSKMPIPIPVILMSGYSVTSPLIKGLVNGKLENCPFIAKPFVPAELLDKVSEILHQASPRVQTSVLRQEESQFHETILKCRTRCLRLTECA